MLGNIGTVELFVIMLTILLVFGAKRIPEIARALGEGIREFRAAGRAIAEEFRIDDDLLSNRSPRTPRREGAEARFDRRSVVQQAARGRGEAAPTPAMDDSPIMPENSADAGLMPS